MGLSARVVALGLLLMASGSAVQGAPAATVRAPHARELQQTITGCSFTSGNGLLTRSWIDTYGWLLVTPKAAMACLNQMQVGYDFAYESVTNLAAIFNASYVFAAMAANPTDGIALSSIVYDYPVDAPGELMKYANSLPEGRSVGLADLQFTVSEVFNKLHDAHVTYTGLSTSGDTGTMLGDAVRKATGGANATGSARVYLIDPSTGELVLNFNIAKSGNGTLVVSAEFLDTNTDSTERTFRTINGTSPMDFIINLANSPILSFPYKPPGTRVNQLISSMAGLLLSSLGNMLKLRDVDVVYDDGSKGRLVWAVTFLPSVSASLLQRLQQAANTPGVPFKALQKAVQAYQTGELPVASSQAEPDSPPVRASRTSRRRLQSLGLPRLTYIKDVKTLKTVGFYYFNSSSAILKISTFGFGLASLQKFWPKFVSDAKAQGADELIIDLTGNGGGVIVSGVALALGLYPMATYGDFGLRYDRIMSEDAVYANGLGELNPDKINITVFELMSNTTFVDAAVAYLKYNQTYLGQLVQATKSAVAAITVLLDSASKEQQQTCKDFTTSDTLDCRDLWDQNVDGLTRRANSLLEPGGLTADALTNLVTGWLTPLMEIFWPYTGADGDRGSDPYASPQLIKRGGKWRNYTAKFDVNGVSPSVNYRTYLKDLPATYKAPFSKILAVSDGYCGSTCDTFSRTASFYSKRNPSAPVFKFLTFGGTGRAADASPTSYPGGNVNGDDFLTASWAYYVMGQLVGAFSFWDNLVARFDYYSSLLPIFPAFLDNLTPQYTQSEVYQAGALGPDAIPSEYLKAPTDYFVPAWYTATGLPTGRADDASDLPALYNAAMGVLASMPGPVSAATNKG